MRVLLERKHVVVVSIHRLRSRNSRASIAAQARTPPATPPAAPKLAASAARRARRRATSARAPLRARRAQSQATAIPSCKASTVCVQGIGLVGDRGEEAKTVRSEQRTLRRTHEPVREVEGRHAGRVPVIDGFAETPDRRYRHPSEPVAEAPMDLATSIVRNLTGGCGSNQIVRRPEHTRRLDDDPACDELARRLLDLLRPPIAESGRIGERQRARGDREEREQRDGIGARTAEAGGDQATRVDLGATTSDQGLQPERRPAGLLGELTCHVVAEPSARALSRARAPPRRPRARAPTCRRRSRRQHLRKRLPATTPRSGRDVQLRSAQAAARLASAARTR